MTDGHRMFRLRFGVALAKIWHSSSKSTPVSVADVLSDMDACCERLNHALERVLVGTRPGGLVAQRSPVSLGSVINGAVRHVTKNAEAKRVRIRVALEEDIMAVLDRALLTCGIASLMSQIINSSHVDTEMVLPTSWRTVKSRLVFSVRPPETSQISNLAGSSPRGTAAN